MNDPCDPWDGSWLLRLRANVEASRDSTWQDVAQLLNNYGDLMRVRDDLKRRMYEMIDAAKRYDDRE